jgi:hypothetical protein
VTDTKARIIAIQVSGNLYSFAQSVNNKIIQTAKSPDQNDRLNCLIFIDH